MTMIRNPPLAHVSVSDAMHTGLLTTDADTPLSVAAKLMTDRQVHAVAVVQRGVMSRPMAILSALDVTAVVASGVDEPSAGDAARTDVVTVCADVGIETAAQIMVDEHLSHLIVVSPASGQVEGILSALDIAAVYGQ